jgi:sialic acid synthase SpsE
VYLVTLIKNKMSSFQPQNHLSFSQTRQKRVSNHFKTNNSIRNSNHDASRRSLSQTKKYKKRNEYYQSDIPQTRHQMSSKPKFLSNVTNKFVRPSLPRRGMGMALGQESGT